MRTITASSLTVRNSSAKTAVRGHFIPALQLTEHLLPFLLLLLIRRDHQKSTNTAKKRSGNARPPKLPKPNPPRPSNNIANITKTPKLSGNLLKIPEVPGQIHASEQFLPPGQAIPFRVDLPLRVLQLVNYSFPKRFHGGAVFAKKKLLQVNRGSGYVYVWRSLE